MVYMGGRIFETLRLLEWHDKLRDELERVRRRRSRRYNPGIYLYGLLKITKRPSQNSEHLGRDSNRTATECDSGTLPLRQPAWCKRDAVCSLWGNNA
jgi:hypothetical protein